MFGPENVVIMFRTAMLAVLTRFQKQQNIYRFILNQQHFDENFISKDPQLIKCYQLQARQISRIGSRFYQLFDEQFVDICSDFLQQNLFSYEL